MSELNIAAFNRKIHAAYQNQSSFSPSDINIRLDYFLSCVNNAIRDFPSSLKSVKLSNHDWTDALFFRKRSVRVKAYSKARKTKLNADWMIAKTLR